MGILSRPVRLPNLVLHLTFSDSLGDSVIGSDWLERCELNPGRESTFGGCRRFTL